MYHEIDQIVCGYARRYKRFMLPLADAGGKIVRLAFATSYIKRPVKVC